VDICDLPVAGSAPGWYFTMLSIRLQFDIRTCEIIQSDLPGKQTKLVLAWAELHQEELMANWALVMNGEELFKIQPLQ
jgi:hypothetical protein